MGSAMLKEKDLVELASACSIPMDAAEDCTMAVTSAPTIMPITGFVNTVSMWANSGESWRGDTASCMVLMPIISRAKPTAMPPMSFLRSCLEVMRMMTPISAMTGAKVVGFKSCIQPSPSRPARESIHVVMVVPMWEPMITGMAWDRRMSPELAKPTSITVVADEDCTTAVTTIPRTTALNRLDVSFSNICSSLPPASFSSFSLIRLMP